MSIDICKELHQNFIDFAYEANSQRAFPDARDGLKPGQRACLWEFYDKGYSSKKPHVKSAKIDGGVIGSWWPHGQVAVYETFARMSLPWGNNVPEVDWHGSNGNLVLGFQPASDRYTEARLSSAAEEGMFSGIKKNNVPMILNFSEDAYWPEVLPAVMPRLMLNGAQGIGVTIANHWLLYNFNDLTEVIKKYVLENQLDYSKLYPDFPTGGILVNKDEISTIHETGRGRAIVRAKAEIKEDSILITEFPYQVYIEPWIDSVKDLIQKEEITGIENIYNKSDKKRILVEVECSKGKARSVLNKLFSATDLQKVYNANQYALVGKTPKLLNLKEYLDVYIEHNISCIRKEYEFDKIKAEERLEIVEGLLKAIANIDLVISTIKHSNSSSEAQINLIKNLNFSAQQAKAIVAMRLGSLAHLEAIELNNEEKTLLDTINKCKDILSSKLKQEQEFINRLENLTTKYGANRKTEVTQINLNKSKEDKEEELIEPEKCVVVLTEGGSIKRIPITSFKQQKKNTKGIKTQDDITAMILRTNTVDNLMVFTNKGNVYRLLVNDIPVGTNSSTGVQMSSILPLESDEKPQIIYSIYKDTDKKFVLFVTKQGIIKKTPIEEYSNIRKRTGVNAIILRENDSLTSVSLIDNEQIILITKLGMSIRINSTDFSPQGRSTIGVKGITLKENDEVIACVPIRDNNDDVGLFCESGISKRVPLSEFVVQKRGGKGLVCYKPTNSTGILKSVAMINDDDSILVVTDKTSLCISCADILKGKRASIGGQIIKTGKVKTVTKV